ncbi:glycoside hydrolase family 3 N-terminal domain-containing protein [Corynebacterium sp. A21]|uniref:glycoside hydrolase family 3 N-terminal domain-containing protein n=1 Tax=Corynebacterium sp. A21 TaxID=3457318 RepID=UPI003FD5E150
MEKNFSVKVALLTAAALCGGLLVACTPETTGPDESETTSSSPISEKPTGNPATTESSTATPTFSDTPAQAELRAQVASLMMVGVTSYEDALAKLQQGAGGIFITSWADPAILTEPGRDIAALREAVGRDFQVSIDFEGGRVQRHAEVLGSWPAPREMAATRSPEEVRALAQEMGQSLADHGITVNFAPVVDLDIAELDVVGDRSFSPDPVVAAEYAAAFATGMADTGVRAVFKHFPGHGQASGDTHTGFAVTPPIETVREQDLPPFGQVFATAPGDAMVGHMVVPGLGNETLPSSLDPAVYQLLRSGDYPQGVPFGGIAYTDDLSGMAAITDLMSTSEAAAAAIAAGADQALWSSDLPLDDAINAVMAGIASGAIPEERIHEAAARVQAQFVT